MRIEQKEWMIPIVFEGIELSPISISIDSLGMYDHLPGIPEETSKWLWHFTICRGVVKVDAAKTIHKHISKTLSLVKSHKDQLINKVNLRFDGKFTNVHLAMWIKDLETIIEICKNMEQCSWTAKE